MTSPETALEQRISRSLDRAGINYERQPSIQGLRPDLIVHGPKGRKIIVEVKSWSPGGGNTARAAEQAEHYRRVTKADHAFVVMDALKRNRPEAGVVNEQGLLNWLKIAFEGEVATRLASATTSMATRLSRIPSSRANGGRKFKARGKRRYKRSPGHEMPTSMIKRALSPARREKRTIFAAMPFTRQYDDTFFVAMVHAAERVDAVCDRVDLADFSGDIVKEIERRIRRSAAVIVDLSESKPNVLYEAGYAHALEKPVVHICSTPLDELPFDVRNWNALSYDIGRTTVLREPLMRRLRSALDV